MNRTPAHSRTPSGRAVHAATLSGLVILCLSGNPADPDGPTPARGAAAVPFVPNLGQWAHPAAFVHRGAAGSLFLEPRGWTLALHAGAAPEVRRARRGSIAERPDPRGRVGLRMTFEGDPWPAQLIGEQVLAGYDNYFLGADPGRWRTRVPRYASVRYVGLYTGIDLRMRSAGGVPEYDLLLEPGADLAQVVVHVEGSRDLRLAADGSLIIDTGLGPLRQPVPETWQVDATGRTQPVSCHFELRGPGRFGFAAPTWDRSSTLTIDPPLLWSSFLGGSGRDWAEAVAVDGQGMAIVAGISQSNDFPTTTGAYASSPAGGGDIVVTRMDPSQTGAAQVRSSTYIGGGGFDVCRDVVVGPQGVITVTGHTTSSDFPTTANAYQGTHQGGVDGFVFQLDAGKTGSAQLSYSTYLGGSASDQGWRVHVGASGVLTVAGSTGSANLKTSPGAFDSTLGGSEDAFVWQLDPGRVPAAQLSYATYLGGSGAGINGTDAAYGLAVGATGVLTLSGNTSSSSFPTTQNAYDRSLGLADQFVTRLDPGKTGAAQLLYSSYFGGGGIDNNAAVHVDASGLVVTLTGHTGSSDFPLTANAYDRTLGQLDAFVSRLDTSKVGSAQLVYSTLVGGRDLEFIWTSQMDAQGRVTVVGLTMSPDFPTTSDAVDRSYNGTLTAPEDGFVFQVDPRRSGSAQLGYATFLGGQGGDRVAAVAVDASGVATVAGATASTTFPTTAGAYGPSLRGAEDTFVARLSMGRDLYADRHEVRSTTGGRQQLDVDAGAAHAGRPYWIFGSASGESPGIQLLGFHIPLNPDVYTDFAMANVNRAVLQGFAGTLDGQGRARATLVIPPIPSSLVGVTLHHAALVYDPSGAFRHVSEAVPLRVVR